MITKNLLLIRASELTQYSFCQRAWWLGTVKRVRPTNQAVLTRGTELHYRHADTVRAALRWRRVGLVLLAGGGLLFALVVLIVNSEFLIFNF